MTGYWSSKNSPHLLELWRGKEKKYLTSAAKPFEAKVMSTPLGATIGAKEVVFHRNNISPDLQPYYEARHSLEELLGPTVPCFQS